MDLEDKSPLNGGYCYTMSFDERPKAKSQISRMRLDMRIVGRKDFACMLRGLGQQ